MRDSRLQPCLRIRTPAFRQASAPASEAHNQVLLDLDLSPLLDLPLIRTTAIANWVSDTECVSSDTPLSFSDQALADLTLLGGAALPGGGSVADLNTDNAEGAADAGRRGALHSHGRF